MEAAACGRLLFFDSIGGQHMCECGKPPSFRQGFADEVAFEINVGVNFMSDVIVALIELEADIVGGRTDPDRSPLDAERRLPETQVMTSGDNRERVSVSEAVVLHAAEQ